MWLVHFWTRKTSPYDAHRLHLKSLLPRSASAMPAWNALQSPRRAPHNEEGPAAFFVNMPAKIWKGRQGPNFQIFKTSFASQPPNLWDFNGWRSVQCQRGHAMLTASSTPVGAAPLGPNFRGFLPGAWPGLPPPDDRPSSVPGSRCAKMYSSSYLITYLQYLNLFRSWQGLYFTQMISLMACCVVGDAKSTETICKEQYQLRTVFPLLRAARNDITYFTCLSKFVLNVYIKSISVVERQVSPKSSKLLKCLLLSL